MTLDRSLSIILPAIIGGMGTSIGPILGAFILTPLDYVLTASIGGLFRGVHMVLEGIFLMVIVLIMPSGIMGLLERMIYAKKAAS
jgi:branched-chain amino acid transport system permease protein